MGVSPSGQAWDLAPGSVSSRCHSTRRRDPPKIPTVWRPFGTGQSARAGSARPFYRDRCARWLLVALLLCGGLPAWGADQEELLFHRGVAAYAEGDYAAARKAFEAVLGNDSTDAGARLYIGLIARQEGDLEAAIEAFRSSISLAPDDVAAHVVLTETLLTAGRNEEARAAAERGLALSRGHATLRLYAGIAEYRTGDPRAALGHLDRAAREDPSLRREARYYAGLAQAGLGNLYASASAFGDVEASSPGHPLGDSARALRDQMEPSTPDRIWFLSTTAGIELDSNPTARSDVFDPSSDVAGTFRLRGLVDAYRGGGFTLRAGYDGFLAGYASATNVNEQTHVAGALAIYDYKNTSFNLRYDYAITLLDFTKTLRSVHMIEPLVNLRVGRWGVTQGFYKYQRFDYSTSPAVVKRPELERNGNLHAVGANHIFLLEEPFTYARIGVMYMSSDTKGSEFAFTGVEINAGGGLILPWYDISLSGLYRFARRSYENPSIFPATHTDPDPAPGQGVSRNENVHNISFNLSAPVWRRLTVALSGTLGFHSSQVDVLSYDRHILGSYLTWDF